VIISFGLSQVIYLVMFNSYDRPTKQSALPDNSTLPRSVFTTCPYESVHALYHFPYMASKMDLQLTHVRDRFLAVNRLLAKSEQCTPRKAPLMWRSKHM
jgi:hypothetical protein